MSTYDAICIRRFDNTERVYFHRYNTSENKIRFELEPCDDWYFIYIYFISQLCENDNDNDINLTNGIYKYKELQLALESKIYGQYDIIDKQIKSTIFTFIEVKKELIQKIRRDNEDRVVNIIINLVTGKQI
jgi:hypothetical protein